MTLLKLESSQELVVMVIADLTENKSQNANSHYTEFLQSDFVVSILQLLIIALLRKLHLVL